MPFVKNVPSFAMIFTGPLFWQHRQVPFDPIETTNLPAHAPA
jgi:hypothetical protein